MNRHDSAKLGKIMLVCSKPSDEVEKCLRSIGGEIVMVNDGEAAITQAQRATFNLAVLVSTGKTMDLAETVFNLRDISASMRILIIDERHGARKSQADMIAAASPNIRTLSVHDLAAYLEVRGSLPRRTFTKRHHNTRPKTKQPHR